MNASDVTSVRPAWVHSSFAGGCKVFPATNAFLLPYQRAWVQETGKMAIMEKARQVGISLATAYAITTQTPRTTNRYDDWISSRDDVQAGLMVRDCRRLIRLFEPACTENGMPLLSPDDEGGLRKILWNNGCVTHSLSSNIDAQAGKAGSRYLDEFALHRDPKSLYGIANPGKAWGGRMRIISTHRGSANYFNTLIEETRNGGNPKGFSLHRVTLEDGLNQGLLYKLQARMQEGDKQLSMDEAQYFDSVRAECPDEATFLEEYMCKPADDESAFIDYGLIGGCEYGESEQWEESLGALADSEHDLFMGIDVGRKKHLTVMWVLKRVSGILLTVHLVTLFKQPFDVQERHFHDLMGLPRMRRACIDETGIGMQLAENGARVYGHRVEPITFTNDVKEWLAYPLRTRFERRSLRIPNCIAVRADIHSVRKEYTAAGNIRFVGDDGSNGHADRFWALALANHAESSAINPGPIVPSETSRRAMIAADRWEREIA